MSGFDAAGAIVDAVCANRHPDAQAVQAAQTFVLDSLGVGLAGSQVPWSATLVRSLHADSPGMLCAWGHSARLSAPAAAMVNAYQIHNQEYDCVHEEAVVHPMAVVLSCLLVLAQQRGGISGRDLIAALCVGVDVAVLLGVASAGAMRFFRPGICGALGATAGMARLLRLNRECTANALGIAYSQMGGTMQAHLEGSPSLPMQIAFNARNAVVAVQLAEAGLAGPRDIIAGRFGFFALYEQPGDVQGALARLGSGEIRRVSHKPFPTGRAAHGALDALLRLGAGASLAPERIASVTLWAPPLICRLIDREARPDMVPGYARLCLGYCAARLLQSGRVALEDFSTQRIAEPDWEALAARVQVQQSEVQDPNAMAPQRLEVVLRDGTELAVDIDAVLGSPDNPLSTAQCRDKYLACTDHAGLERARADALAECVQALDSLDDVRRLCALLGAQDEQEHGG